MKYDITDFSTKDSSEYNSSVALYEDALNQVDSDLLNFKEASLYRDEIPTRLRRKTHNSPDFLDESKARKKMNADTSAIAELTNSVRINEELMFGAGQDALETELIKGGLGLDILKAFKKHNVTGKAIWDSLKSLKSYVGANTDILAAMDTLKDASEGKASEEEVETNETEDEDLDERISNKNTDILSEKVRNIQKRLAEKNLRRLLLK